MLHGYADRAEAGRVLAQELASREWVDPVVLALPRGGVPVAAEIARVLKAPMDLVLVKKIGVPGQPELAIAALVDTQPEQLVLDEETMAACGASLRDIERQLPAARDELARRRRCYLGGRPRLSLRGRTAIVVDDGIATGTSLRAALRAVRLDRPARVVVAVPVAPPEALRDLQAEADEWICPLQPAYFMAVGAHYRDFEQVRDEEVLACLALA